MGVIDRILKGPCCFEASLAFEWVILTLVSFSHTSWFEAELIKDFELFFHCWDL
jgi:hypothetical protein